MPRIHSNCAPLTGQGSPVISATVSTQLSAILGTGATCQVALGQSIAAIVTFTTTPNALRLALLYSTVFNRHRSDTIGPIPTKYWKTVLIFVSEACNEAG